MRRLARLDLAQRIVAVVALAGLLRTLGTYFVDRIRSSVEGGWFNYAPLTEDPFPGSGFPDGGWRMVAATLVWIVLIAAWGAISIWLFGLPYRRNTDAERE